MIAMDILRAARRDRRGVAALELAIVLPVMVVIVAMIVDLGFCYNARLATMRGMNAAALYAYRNGGTVTIADAHDVETQLQRVTREVAGNQDLAVTVLLNGAAMPQRANEFFCAGQGLKTWISTGYTRAPCPDGAMSAKIYTIRTSGITDSPIPLALLGATLLPLDDQIVVRAR